jgi:hypothetical protein
MLQSQSMKCKRAVNLVEKNSLYADQTLGGSTPTRASPRSRVHEICVRDSSDNPDTHNNILSDQIELPFIFEAFPVIILPKMTPMT